jgi:hypothetical protein
MKSSWFKKLVPHGVAVLIFLVVAFVYCKPVLEGKVVAQHDITHWKGSIQQSLEYQKTHDGKGPYGQTVYLVGCLHSRSVAFHIIMSFPVMCI